MSTSLTSNTMKRQRDHHEFYNLSIGLVGDEWSVESAKKLCEHCGFETVEYVIKNDQCAGLKSWINAIKDKVCHVVSFLSKEEHLNVKKMLRCGVSNHDEWPSFLRLFMEPMKLKIPRTSPLYVDDEDDKVYELFLEWMSTHDRQISSLVKHLTDGNARHVKILISDEIHNFSERFIRSEDGKKKRLHFSSMNSNLPFCVIYEENTPGQLVYKGVQHEFDLKNTTLLIIDFTGSVRLIRCDECVESKFQNFFWVESRKAAEERFARVKYSVQSSEQMLLEIEVFEIRFHVFSVE